jgi:hypothetical protein
LRHPKSDRSSRLAVLRFSACVGFGHYQRGLK